MGYVSSLSAHPGILPCVTDRQHDIIILAMIFLLAALAGLMAGLAMEYF
jgi:hypothetical protein